MRVHEDRGELRLDRAALSTTDGIALQQRWRRSVVRRGAVARARLIAGVDVSVRGDRSRAAVVAMAVPELEVFEIATADRPVQFPYVPGLLSLREVPVVLDAFERLNVVPDLLFVDGLGYVHPRRFGLACHLGVALDVPAIGIGKTPYIGTHARLGSRRGSGADLVDDDEVIGRVLRTRANVKPIYVSVGHRIGLDAAVEWALRCAPKYRLPEPIRAAHRAAGA